MISLFSSSPKSSSHLDLYTNPSSFPTFLAFLLLIPLLALFVQPLPVYATGNTQTIFIPLKINSDSDGTNISETADKTLKESVTPKGFTLLSRDIVSQAVDFNGSWPPAFESLNAIIPADTDYLVAGSLTKTGDFISVDMVVLDMLDSSQAKYYFEEGKTTDLLQIFNRITSNILAFTNRHSIVATVSISGNKKIDSGAIIQKIGLSNGSAYDPATLRQALKNIYAMGYFEDISVQVNESESGRDIIFEVVEKPVVGQILISGDKELEADDIREVIEIVPNNIISTRDVQDSVESIKALYKEKGFYDTRISTVLTDTDSQKVDVEFKIKEGQKVFIKDIIITGNNAFKDKTLKKILQTSERGWLSWFTDSGVLNHDIVDQDSSRLGAYYHNNGYIDAKVGSPEIIQDGEWITVTFNVEEGDRYRVGTVDITGDLIEDKALLFRRLNIINEKFFSSKILRDDVLSLTDRYAEKGYAFAEANPTTSKDLEFKRVNIVIDLVKQDLVYINRIIVKGNSRTRDKVIRRQMLIKETGIFNAAALKKSHNRLQRLEYFETVEINPVPTVDDTLMDIVVEVEEKATGNFSIGAGYSSIDSFMFMGEISQNNFLGKGQHMALQANISGNSTQYNLKFTEPQLADSKLLFGIDFYDWQRDYDDYTKDSQGVGIRFGYPIWKLWHLSAGYTFDDSVLSDVLDTAPIEILDSQDINTTSAINFGLGEDTRNRGSDPSEGHTYSIRAKYAGGFLGGDSEFTKLEGTTNWYYPITKETVVHWKLSAGEVYTNSDDKLPVYEKFYLGGINSIRGFKSGSISPRDLVRDVKIGGDKMWYYNLEWIFPLVKEAGLKGLVFFDVGNVYGKDANWDFSDIKKSTGFGFRWLSPMGPLRLEWGYNLDPKEYEVQDNWDFNIGGAF
nr:outer membrane protein assembly factor BamA [Desulfobulbaceae bacterium]